jgi:hypothetical protein
LWDISHLPAFLANDRPHTASAHRKNLYFSMLGTSP